MLKFILAEEVANKEGQELADLDCNDPTKIVEISNERKRIRISLRSSLIAAASYITCRELYH